MCRVKCMVLLYYFLLICVHVNLCGMSVKRILSMTWLIYYSCDIKSSSHFGVVQSTHHYHHVIECNLFSPYYVLVDVSLDLYWLRILYYSVHTDVVSCHLVDVEQYDV
jgi:hypothetical protein